MRRVIGGVTLALILLFAGCGKQSEVTGETTELFSSFMISQSGALRFDGYGYLHFYSKETDSWLYLCNRPSCLHRDSSCGAYWGEGYAHAFYYDNSLYVLQIASEAWDGRLFRANRYGEERQEIGRTESFPAPAYTMQIVGSNLYYIGEIWSNDQNEETRVLCRVSLKDGSYDSLPQPDTGYSVESFQEYAVTDEYLYYMYIVSDIDINDFIDWDTGEFTDESWKEIVYATQLYRMDRKTEVFELVFERKTVGAVPHMVEILKNRDEQFLLVLDNQVVEYDSNTGETTLLLDMEAVAAEGWSNMRPVGDLWVVNMSHSQFILLEDWKEIDRFEGSAEAYYQVLGMSDEVVYFVGNNGLSYMDYEDMLNGDYVIHDVNGYW